MAKGRTISATELTETDREALEICEGVSSSLGGLISDLKAKEDFMRNYGRVHKSRDAGLGRAGGKLQRDALCTRGRVDKAPFSNRNLRWHPLIVAAETPPYAQEVEGIELDGKSLVFIVNGELWYPSDVHKLPQVYCAPLHKWFDIKEELTQWNDEDWTANSCVIPSLEYSTLPFSVESFAILGIIVSSFYDVDPKIAYDSVSKVFESKSFSPSKEFPARDEMEEIILCPLCLGPLREPPARLALPDRKEIFQAPWRRTKREEGEAESLQLFHVEPLVEGKILHQPKLVRYGHRWCNVATGDHSISETVDFMKAVVEAHDRRRAKS
jgi:hypothetical protein